MKARVKATGELIDLPRLTRVYSYEEDESMFFLKDLEILDNIQPDYWSRLEHKAAIAAMQALLSSDTTMGILSRRDNGTMEEEVAREAFDYAHTLVQKLKEKEE